MPPLTQDTESLDWIKVLLDELERRSRAYVKFDNYYSGRQGARFVATGYRELFTQAFEFYRENVCKTVIESVEHRLDIDGFRFPAAASSASATDEAAWQIWQDNALDARSQLGHMESMVNSVAYVLVDPFNSRRVGPGGRSPRITLEKATQAIVAYAPGGTERLVGLKTWYDATAQRRFVTLYYPDRIEKFQGGGREWANQWGRGYKELAGTWDRRIVPDEPWPLQHTLDVVPLVPLVNKPRLGEGLWAGIEGDSDLVDIVPIQDGINFLALNGIVASDKAAFPQKWATGVEVPTKVTKDGRSVPSDEWKPDIDAILSTRAPDAKFGNFDVAELSQYDGMIRAKLATVAIIAQIPLTDFLPQTGQPASGEAREASEIKLRKKAERKQRSFGEGWEEAMRLAFRQLGDEQRANETACKAVWRSAGVEPSASKIDALSKERDSLHVPLEVLWERAGYTPTDRARFREMIEAERKWLNSTPVATTQPDAVPEPGAAPQGDTSGDSTGSGIDIREG